MGKVTRILDEKGKELKSFCHGYFNHNTDEELSFYTDDGTLAGYPVYTSGKRKGDIAFKKDGTLILSDTLLEKIELQNGYFADGVKNVDVNFPHGLKVIYKKKKFYGYQLIELYKKALESEIGHIHSIEKLRESYNNIVGPWDMLQVQTKVSIWIKTPNNKLGYKLLYVNKQYVGNDYSLDKLIEALDLKDGEYYDFRAPIARCKEEPFTINAEAAELL